MSSTVDRAQPYPIKLPSQQAAGELHVGWRSYPVQVIDISWQAVTVAIPPKASKRIRLNSHATVWYQGNAWRSIADKPCRRESGQTLLQLTLADQTDPRLLRMKRASKANTTICGEQNVNSDPLVIAVLIIGVIIAFLIMPGWGDELGTSQTIPTAFQEFFKAVGGVFRRSTGG